ncbi:hypothetical protein LCM19_00770 [Qipengyuania flava]|nr:hypothetical protein [Qipengyuania flava]
MFTRNHLPFIALILAAPTPLVAQSVQDFQLPPNPTPTPSPRVQGPVDTEGDSIPARPRVIGTPTPTPAPASTPRQASPVPQPTVPQSTPTPLPSARPAPARTAPIDQVPKIPRNAPITLPTADERAPLGESVEAAAEPNLQGEDQVGEATGEPMPTEGGLTAPLPEADTEKENAEWIWPAVGGGILALLGLGYFLSRRRSSAPAPIIEKPVVGSGGPVNASDIHIRTEAIKLTRSVMNATLHYRVSLLNKATRALSNVAIGADVVSAHGGFPMEQQVAGPDHALEKRHQFDRIAPGQNVRYEGQITIPLSQIRAIRQNKAALFVPLLRLRIDGATPEPLVKTFVVGLGMPEGGRVMPFRIDEGPRSYEPIAARALD